MSVRRETDYGQARKRDVAKGLETAQLAGLLTQKYGYGLCDAFGEIYRESHRGATYCPNYSDVDKIVASLNPEWEATQAARWKSQAGLDLSTPRNVAA